MASGRTPGKALQEIQRLCLDGLDAWALRTAALQRLQSLVSFDCAWWATADPATLLLTGGLSENIPEKAAPLFLANEILGNDVNKFSALALMPNPVNTLFTATEGKLEHSPRFREILRPYGMGDEMRIALREGGLTWGFICMHRTANATPFSAAEMTLLGGLGSHLAGGLRNALLLAGKTPGPGHEAPGVVTLTDDLSIVHTTPNAAVWLDEMADQPTGGAPAQAVASVAALLLSRERDKAPGSLVSPRVRIRTRAGRWLTLHAMRFSSIEQGGQIAVVIEPARPEEMAPLLLSAYALTERERNIAQYVLRGMSNKVIGRALSVSPLTVQQHLKAIFEKMGVHSRGELTGRVMVEYHRESIPGTSGAKINVVTH